MKLFSLLNEDMEGCMYPDAWVFAGNLWAIGDKEPHGWYIGLRVPFFSTMTQYDFLADRQVTGRKTIAFGVSQYFFSSMDFPVFRVWCWGYPR